MLIKKVYLENYRSHSNTTVDFSKGVNLILGMNGKGKSSILEAISMTLFNLNDRTGSSKSKKNYIKFGEKIARIKIDFIANDDREYSLETVFNTSKPKKQLLIDEAGIEYSDNVQDKLEELCGIKKGFGDIYENIVIAKQNEFINIFKETGNQREDKFNKIFNTQIYDKMDKDFKLAEDKYKRNKEDLEKEIGFIKTNLKDKEEIKEALSQEKKKEQELEEQKSILEEAEKDLKNEINNYEGKENKINNLKNSYYDKNELKNNKTIELTESKNKKNKAEIAEGIVKDTKDKYNEYLSVEKKLALLNPDKKHLDEEQKANLKYQTEIDKLSSTNKNLEKNLEELNERILKNKEEKKILEEEIFNSEEKENILKSEIKEYKDLIEDLDSIKNERDSKEKEKNVKESELKKIQGDIETKKNSIAHINIEELEKKLLSFSEIEKSLKKIQAEKTGLERDVDTLKKSSKELSTSICPYLKENCENLKGKDFESYFSEEISKKELEIEKLKASINRSEEKLLEKKLIEDEKIKYYIFKSDITNLNKALKEIEVDLKVINNFIKERELSMKEIFLSELLVSKNIKTVENLKELKIKSDSELKNLNLDEKRKNLRNLDEEISKENSKILSEQKEKLENKSKIEDYKNKIIIDTDKKLQSINQKIEELEPRKEALKKSHDDYLENKTLASELESLKNRNEVLITDIKILEEELEKIKQEGEKISEELNKVNIGEKKENLKKIESEISSIDIEKGKSQEKIKNYEKVLSEIEEKEKKVELLTNDLKKNENKYIKTQFIRKNIVNMGKDIAQYMLVNISNTASVNFNKITGRTERIEWSNKDTDKYAVYLIGQDKEIPFEQLSGGEQVSVAIAIRGAMTHYFTNSKFMILDEPTNNLDIEKRKLLSEYVGEILKDLDQTIIVTHDDTFREMAEKIIEL